MGSRFESYKETFCKKETRMATKYLRQDGDIKHDHNLDVYGVGPCGKAITDYAYFHCEDCFNKAMVKWLRENPGKTITDTGCGSPD